MVATHCVSWHRPPGQVSKTQVVGVTAHSFSGKLVEIVLLFLFDFAKESPFIKPGFDDQVRTQNQEKEGTL
jgi:hypothetical protein